MTVLESFRLEGKVALVTGGGGVLGAVLARTLAEAGAKVWVTDLVEEQAQDVARTLRDGGLAADLQLRTRTSDRVFRYAGADGIPHLWGGLSDHG